MRLVSRILVHSSTHIYSSVLVLCENLDYLWLQSDYLVYDYMILRNHVEYADVLILHWEIELCSNMHVLLE